MKKHSKKYHSNLQRRVDIRWNGMIKILTFLKRGKTGVQDDPKAVELLQWRSGL